MVENTDLYAIRESIAEAGYQISSPYEANKMLERVIIPFQERELDLIIQDPELIDKRFRRIQEHTGVAAQDFEPAAFAAVYAISITMHQLRPAARVAWLNQFIPDFILFFDTSVGSSSTLHPILESSDALLPKLIPLSSAISTIAGSAEQASGNAINIADQAQMYLRLDTEVKRSRVLFAETDDRHPQKGFMLLDERLKQIQGVPNRLGPSYVPTFLAREFVEAGADFAAAIFRAIYPQAEQFVTSKS